MVVLSQIPYSPYLLPVSLLFGHCFHLIGSLYFECFIFKILFSSPHSKGIPALCPQAYRLFPLPLSFCCLVPPLCFRVLL